MNTDPNVSVELEVEEKDLTLLEEKILASIKENLKSDRGEHEGSDNLLCFGFIIDMHENHDEEAACRILDAFIAAVEAEGGCAGGGVHKTGTNSMCQECKDELEDE